MQSIICSIIKYFILILKGNWTELAYKINKKIIKPIKSYVNSRNVGS